MCGVAWARWWVEEPGVSLVGRAKGEGVLAVLRGGPGLAGAGVELKRTASLPNAAELVIYYEEPRAKTTARPLPRPAPKS